MKNKLPVLLLFAVLAGAFIAFQLRTVRTVFSPQLVTTGHGTQPATASTTSDQVTEPAISTTAPAISQPTAVTELEKIFSALPAGSFRASLMKLPEPDRRRALAKLARLNVPKEDYPSLRASAGGELYYVCNDLIPPAALAASTTLATTAAASTAAASVPIASPPVRHSKPGSTKILYLDFNGLTITGTSWNSDNSVTTYQALPYDTDGDPTTFSDAEQAVILEVWSRVAEDYAPFDVDVTTEAPATFTKTTGRALITKNTDANGVSMPSSSAGGVAYLDVFGDANYATATSPALIYYNNLAGGTNASYIGEAVSHELGHNLGLSHDGKTDGTAYYTGHGTGETSWAPIMGSPYNKNVTQWSKGEYYLANNTEDQLAIISGKLSYRADEAGATIGTAVALTVSSGSFSTSGLINNSTDVDVYSVALGAGSLTLSVTGFRAASGTDGGNTDLKLELLNSSGTVLATSDPADSTKASLTYTVVTAGTYYVRLTPVGTGTPTASTPTGYTSYACIGQYTLTGLGAGTVAPSISTQPASQTITAGTSVTFSVIASGTPTPTYQWYFNNSALSGATSTSYTIASTTTANAGSYTVTATNSTGSVTSSAATLTVNVVPAISAQPASTSITSGNTTTLNVIASGTPAPTYQWYQGSSGTTASPISGAISSSFTTPTLTVTTSYWVRVTNSAGSVDSSTATITVNAITVVPAISTQPASTSITSGNTATLSVVASGTPSPTYQWYQGTSGNTTSPVSGATSSSYTTPTLTATTSYWVRVSNSAGSVDSSTATITVNAVTVAPSISSQPASQSVISGSSVTFSVIASGTPTPTYQWYFNNSALSGATSTSYTIASTTTANAGSYTVTVTNSAGNVTSSAATVTVNVAPAISAQPASTAITSGNTATLSVVASGTPAPTYQWYQGPSGTTASLISGATSSSYTTPTLTVTTSYWVRVTNSAGSVDSSTATITVAASVPVITSSLLVGAVIAEPFAYTITATNQPTAFSTSSLPAGLSLNLATGAITGTPTASGTFLITLGATNASSTGNATLSLFITPSVAIVTLAGKSGATGASDATAATATFNAPNDIAIDSSGTLYVADTGNHTIRKISLDNRVTTVAGLAGTSGSTNANGTSARFNAPSGIVIDSSGNLYVADTNNHAIRKIDTSANVTTFAGSPGQAGTTDGTGTNARFNLPSDLSFDPSGNLYVADTANHTIRKITSTGVVTTLVGQAGVAGSANGTGTAAQFSSPADVLAVGTSTLYVADAGNNTIRKITLNGTTATVTTLAGLAGSPGSSDGVGAAAHFNSVNGLALGSDGYLYVADTLNQVIRRINPADGLVVTLVGAAGNAGSFDGIGASARLDYPLGLAADNSGDVYVADSSSPTIRQLGFYGSPAFITQPVAQTATAGTNVTFTVSANGQPSPIYQWYKDGTALSGASSSSLSISNVQSSNAGSYTVIASNLVGTATSNAAALTVTSSSSTSSSSSGSSSSSSSSGSNAGGGGGGAVSYVYLTGLAALCALRRALRKN